MSTVETTENEAASLAALKNASFINLITYRKTGAPVATPVWFADHDGTFYLTTGLESGKYKRARNNHTAQVAVCDARGRELGKTFQAHVRIVSEASELELAEKTLQKKYGLKRRTYFIILNTIQRLRRRPISARGFLAIEDIGV